MKNCACGEPTVRGKHGRNKCSVSAEGLLNALRPDVDTIHIEPISGEPMWLKEHFNAAGKRDGITDCCYAEEPCEWHKAVAESRR